MRLHHILVPFLLSSSNVMAQESYTLESLERLAQDTNPALQAAQRDVAIARSEVSTARALPNPTVEFMTGPMRYKPVASGISGNATSYSLTQPLDLPFSRTPRIEAARAGLAASEAGFAGQVTNWLANLRMAYYDVLRRTAEQVVAEEDVGIVRSVQQKVAFSVKQGETAKFEAIRTEAELLNVQKTAAAAALRVQQARSQLRMLVGPALPENFKVSGRLQALPKLPAFDELVEQVALTNPELVQARAQKEQARYRLRTEEAQRLPQVSLRAERSGDAEQDQTRFGVSVTVPIWDRRKGPVAAAEAQLSKSTYGLEAREYAVRQELVIAYKQYEIAQNTVAALEGGVVSQAQSALKIAEAAYRFGERGLIDVLDAQRVFRAARADLINSRYDLAVALVEIQRLSSNLAQR
jgi:cobalt-zinc-cadmium efflux system outer membrane protein